jgi:hypothetical protein
MTTHAMTSIQNVHAPLRRTAREAPRAAALRLAGAFLAALLLASCAAVEWVKTRFVEPAASAPAPSMSSAAAQRAAPAPKADAAAPAAPAVPQPPPPARPIAESTPQQVAPLPPAQAAAPAPPPPAAVAAQPAPRVTLAAPAAGGDLAPGRWAVQVGVFYGANSAEAVRARVAARLGQSDLDPESRITRVIKRDNRYFVVVGEAADQRAAEALANRVRVALKQDVALFRR